MEKSRPTGSSEELAEAVQRRLDSLTKPKGSLGRLEQIALQFALLRGEVLPSIRAKRIYVLCADHGITEEGISPFPQVITQQMAANFVRGGAAISVLCRQGGIEPVIVDLGMATDDAVPGTLPMKIGAGTGNWLRGPAMTRAQAEASLEIGRELARRAAADGVDLVGLGEMGIGNTTAAAAVLAVFAGLSPEEAVGPGAGADPSMVARKAEVIRQGLAMHRQAVTDPVGVLSAVGGFETGAVAGFLLEAAKLRIGVVLDGFPGTAGALVAQAIDSRCLQHVFYGHVSAEPGHRAMLQQLGGTPLLGLDMRLGEGTGAALGMHIVEAAVRVYREMATFEEAAVSGQL